MKNIQKFISLIIFLLIALSAFIFFYKPDLISVFSQHPNKAGNLYRQARELQLNSDYKTAYYIYTQISSRFKAYDAVLFQQANCAASLEDEKTAIEKYKKILKNYSSSPLNPLVSYNLGQAYVRLGQTKDAEKQFLYTEKRFKDTDYALGSFYYLGELNQKKNNTLAAKYWLKYIALSPSGRFAANCFEGLKSINYKFTNAELKLIAISFFMQHKYEDALFYFNQLAEKEVWYYKAMSYKALGNKAKALPTLMRGIKFYLNDSLDKSKTEAAILAYVELSGYDNEKDWSTLLSWTKKANDFILYRQALLMPRAKAIKNYERIAALYPDGDFASEAMWALFLQNYNAENYKKALTIAQRHISKYENTKASPAMHFWLGKTYEQLFEADKARKIYKSTQEKFPDSYYAFRANNRLKALSGSGLDTGWRTQPESRLPMDKSDDNMPYSYSEIAQKHNIQATELIKLEDYETALLFIKDDPFIESWIKFKNGIITNSIVTARNAMGKITEKPTENDPKWKLIYPIYYSDVINDNAQENNIDPILVLALMKEESYFNPHAVSSSNARGLMQLLPGTAKDVIRWKGFSSYYENELFNPEINIKLGSAYIGHTRDVFSGDMLFSVAAYNGGPGAVKNWLKTMSSEEMDIFIENIPYGQTRDYVKKVFGTYWNYKRIYGFN